MSGKSCVKTPGKSTATHLMMLSRAGSAAGVVWTSSRRRLASKIALEAASSGFSCTCRPAGLIFLHSNYNDIRSNLVCAISAAACRGGVIGGPPSLRTPLSSYYRRLAPPPQRVRVLHTERDGGRASNPSWCVACSRNMSQRG